jgi:hypothetical protein
MLTKVILRRTRVRVGSAGHQMHQTPASGRESGRLESVARDWEGCGVPVPNPPGSQLLPACALPTTTVLALLSARERPSTSHILLLCHPIFPLHYPHPSDLRAVGPRSTARGSLRKPRKGHGRLRGAQTCGVGGVESGGWIREGYWVGRAGRPVGVPTVVGGQGGRGSPHLVPDVGDVAAAGRRAGREQRRRAQLRQRPSERP